MDISSKGGMKLDSGLESAGMEAKVLTAAQLEEHASQIQGLKYDALNPSQNLHAEGTQGERRVEVKDEIRAMGKLGSRDSVVAVFDEKQNVVGFMAIEKTSPTEAEVKEMWTASSGRVQRGIVRKLLGKAKESLSVSHVQHLTVDLDAATQELGYAATDSTLHHFVRDAGGRQGLSAANDNLQQPEAVNDNDEEPLTDLEKAA